jgi:hypothetical protein
LQLSFCLLQVAHRLVGQCLKSRVIGKFAGEGWIPAEVSRNAVCGNDDNDAQVLGADYFWLVSHPEPGRKDIKEAQRVHCPVTTSRELLPVLPVTRGREAARVSPPTESGLGFVDLITFHGSVSSADCRKESVRVL